MSAVNIQAAKLTGSTGTTSSATVTAPSVGNTVIVAVIIPTASAPGTPSTAFTDNLGNTYTLDRTSSWLYASQTCYFYRKSNIANAPTTISFTGSSSHTAIFMFMEWASMDNASPYVGSISDADLSGGVSQTTHTSNFTTTNANDVALLMVGTGNNRLLSSASNGFSVVLPESVASGVHMAHLADAGASGAKSTLITLSGSASAKTFGAIYKSGKPAVTSVSSPTATEGSAISFTVTLASATTATTGYTGVLTNGTTNVTADLTSTLSTATLSNGVTFSAGNFSVPSGISSWTVTLNTLDDALDEVDETFTLTVDGMQTGTGTITDNDAPPVVTFTDGVESFGVVTCTATLGAVSGKDVSFQVDTTNGTKTAGTNYTAIVAQTVTIPAGSLTATITVNTL